MRHLNVNTKCLPFETSILCMCVWATKKSFTCKIIIFFVRTIEIARAKQFKQKLCFIAESNEALRLCKTY